MALQRIGRFLNVTKNADGSLSLELALGNYPYSTSRTVIVLSSAEVTALSSAIAGGAATTLIANHSSETNLNLKHGDYDG